LSPAVGNAAAPASGVGVNYLASDEFTNTGNTPLTVGYTVVPISADGCLGDPRIVTVTINPEPVVATSLNATVCSDQVTGLVLNTNGLSVAASNYNITASTVSPGLVAAGVNAIVPATGVAAGYLSNDRFNNVGPLPLTVTYTVVPISAAGCVGSPQVITMTINPEPVVATTLNAGVCSDLPIGLVLNTNGTSVGAANYNVTAISVGAGLVAAGTNAAIPATGVNANYVANDVFSNTTNAAITVNYTIVAISAAGCASDPQVVTFTIAPEPVVSTTLDKSVCSDLPIALTLNTNGTSIGAADYNIINRTIAAGLTAGGANAVVPANGVAAAYLANDVFTNNTNSPLTVTYTVVPRSAGNCFGNSRLITVTINPEPVLAPALDRTACSDVNIGLVLNTNGTSVGAGSYNIAARTIAPGLTANAGNVVVPATNVAAGYLAADQFTNTGTLPLAVTYQVVPVSAAGCLGDAVTVTVTIDPEPVVANGLDRTECSDLPIGLNLDTDGTSVAAANYNITSITVAGGLTADPGNVAVPATGVAANYLAGHIFTNTTNGSLTVTYIVVPVSGAGCAGDPKTITVTIDPEPVISAGLDRTVCSDVASGLVITTLGTSVPAASYNVTAIAVDAGLTAAVTNAVIPGTGVTANYLNADQFTNAGATPLTVTYTVVPVSA
ncbi:MAG: beta strand repeat-containing protein, partial [Cyclobacteriaceae bacterium]